MSENKKVIEALNEMGFGSKLLIIFLAAQTEGRQVKTEILSVRVMQ